MTEQSTSVSDVLNAWQKEVSNGPSNFESILRATGSRAAGPLLFLPALVMISPAGAVPGVPVILASLVFLVAGQVVAGRKSLWVPRFLTKRDIPESKVTSTIDWLRPYAEKLDRYLGRRLELLTGALATRLVAVVCIFPALLVFPATLVPFAVALPSAGILVLSLGLLTRDGIVTAAGLGTAGLLTMTLLVLLG